MEHPIALWHCTDSRSYNMLGHQSVYHRKRPESVLISSFLCVVLTTPLKNKSCFSPSCGVYSQLFDCTRQIKSYNFEGSAFGGSMRHVELVDFHCFSPGFCLFLIMTAGIRMGS